MSEREHGDLENSPHLSLQPPIGMDLCIAELTHDRARPEEPSSNSFQMKVHSSKRSPANGHHPLPKSKPATSSIGELVIHKSDYEAKNHNGNRSPGEHRLVRALDDVHSPPESVFRVSIGQHAALELLW
jgi:hypothetical protein